MFYRKSILILCSLLVFAQVSFAQGNDSNEFELSPEEFFNLDMDVVSPAKKLQKLKNVPSAVFVLTQDDIQRSAATSIPDLLRLVPGLHVAQVSSSEWAISSRGFNHVFSNNLLLLIDGTPVETLLFNGIYWENMNIPLEIIERIEVVRGPGAAVWGTRAVNGVVNVITKDAYTFPHHKVEIGGGNELLSAYARTGKILSPDSALQGYLNFRANDSTEGIDSSNHDESENLTLGLRGDFKLSERDSLRITSYLSTTQQDIDLALPTTTFPFVENIEDQREHHRISVASLWDRELSSDSQFSLEWTSYGERRKDFLLDFTSLTSDFELRHRLVMLDSHDFTYGVNFRLYADNTKGTERWSFTPDNRTLEFYRGFLHDEIAILPKKLALTLGSRFEYNDQVGFNALPTARLLWNVTEKLSLWGAASYTVGTPARVYDDIQLDIRTVIDPESGLPLFFQLIGDRDVEAEELLAYEIGLWAEPTRNIYISATAYYFTYDKVLSRETGESVPNFSDPTAPFVNVPFVFDNEGRAESLGAEFVLDWSISDALSLAATYSYINLRLFQRESTDPVLSAFTENAPEHSATIRAHIDLMDSLEADLIVRYVDGISATLISPEIDEYVQGDAQLKWFATPKFDLTLLGRNLFNDSHEEFKTLTFNSPISEVERSVFLKASYSF